MTASDLTEWVAVFLPELVSDGQGGAVETTPANLTADRPANVRPVSGSKVFSGDQLAQRVRYAVTIRYEPFVTPVYRVLWGERLLDIDSVTNVRMESKWLELSCMQHEAGAQ